MVVKMIRQAVGVANHLGSQTRTYEAGEELSANEDWEKARNANFLERGLAEETKVIKPWKQKMPPPHPAKRAKSSNVLEAS